MTDTTDPTKPVAWMRWNEAASTSTGVTDTEYYRDLWASEGDVMVPLVRLSEYEVLKAENKRLSRLVDSTEAVDWIGTVSCPCTTFEQDETCPVGYPSLVCEVCGGRGVVKAETVMALAAEMLKVAEQVDELEDPFAAWESIELLKSNSSPKPSASALLLEAEKALEELHSAEHAKLGQMLAERREDEIATNWQGGRVNGISAATEIFRSTLSKIRGGE